MSDSSNWLSWTVKFSIHKTWLSVERGFNLTDHRAITMIGRELGYAYGEEYDAKVLSAPSAKELATVQGENPDRVEDLSSEKDLIEAYTSLSDDMDKLYGRMERHFMPKLQHLLKAQDFDETKADEARALAATCPHHGLRELMQSQIHRELLYARIRAAHGDYERLDS